MKFVAGILIMTSLTGAATAAQTDLTTAPAGTKVLLTLTGVGVQIYACKSQPAGTPTWIFVAPQARLFDGSAEIGTHSKGPTWTLKDGSSVKGSALATTPSPDPDAIPWLLLKAAATGGSGLLSSVTYIRRSETSGGKTPATGCDGDHLGSTNQVPYKATYTFYAAQ